MTKDDVLSYLDAIEQHLRDIDGDVESIRDQLTETADDIMRFADELQNTRLKIRISNHEHD